ncbi:biopolymer transporter ExbD [candidate division KSB1 bacterium]|nr:biopolymer transporter ExbD [candidate division KSB1 bacterium]
MKFEKKEKAAAEIPTASMPDIIFMLLIFFMVSAVFKEFRGLPVTLPSAKMIEKLETKRNVAYIYTDKDGRVSIDDMIVPIPSIGPIMYQKRVDNPRVIVSLKTDKECKMGVMNDIQEQLREADALRVNYSSKFKG